MSTVQPSPGIVYEGEAVTHLDTREMDWEPFSGFHDAQVKVLTRFDDGAPCAFIVWTPPGIMAPEQPRRHYHTFREFNFVLAGQLPVWEYDGPEQTEGHLVVLKPGYFMERLPGPEGLHGVSPGVGSATGCVSLTWREGTGNWRHEPDHGTGSIDVPFPESAGASSDHPRPQPHGAVVYENAAVKHIDTREMEWEDFEGFPGVQHRVLSRFPSGQYEVMMSWIPPGVQAASEPRRHYHTFSEFSFCLAGEFPVWEYESPEQVEGHLVMRKAGHFMNRRGGPGGIHGVEPGVAVGPTGCMNIGWREAPGNWRFEPEHKQGSIDVPFPA